ncbi:type VI secretion system Vgr family protein [Sinomicrobium sp. M5D2P9]
MPIQTSIRISIEGETLNKFSKVGIVQNVLSHHTFSIKQPLPKQFISLAIDKAQEYIGKAIHIEIEPKNLKDQSLSMKFKGLVTDVDVDRSRGAAGEIVISGTSLTMKMDGIPNTRSYIHKELSSIVQDTLGPHKGSMDLHVQINKDTALDYTVQYKESDFGFLCRMAQKKGEWFYYDGTGLVFGKPKSQSFSLIYGQNITKFNRHMSVKPMGFQYMGYDSEYAENQKMSSGEVGYETQGLAQVMLQNSKRVFPDNGAMMYYHHPISAGNAQSHLHDRVRTQLRGKAAGLVTAKGISTETGLRIGDIVNIKEPTFSLTGDLADGVKEESFGSYYITSVVHACDETGNYSNQFTAIPDTVEAPPYTNVLMPPFAETQSAIVSDNNDPKGLGRIKVKFHWGYESPWIRMTHPYAGGNKGIYFIPETNEEVQVAFEGGNAEKPYIVGALYNGNQKSGYHDAENSQKVIETRSGCRVIFNDKNGSVTIYDGGGNEVLMDGGGNVKITSAKSITLCTDKMSVECNEYQLNAKVKATVDTPEKIENATNSFALNSSNIDVKDGKITIKGDINMN